MEKKRIVLIIWVLVSIIGSVYPKVALSQQDHIQNSIMIKDEEIPILDSINIFYNGFAIWIRGTEGFAKFSGRNHGKLLISDTIITQIKCAISDIYIQHKFPTLVGKEKKRTEDSKEYVEMLIFFRYGNKSYTIRQQVHEDKDYILHHSLEFKKFLNLIKQLSIESSRVKKDWKEMDKSIVHDYEQFNHKPT